MSNRKRPDRNKTALDTIAVAVGNQRISGGCDDCDAYQTVEPSGPGVYVLTVHHDPSCPYYRGATR